MEKPLSEHWKRDALDKIESWRALPMAEAVKAWSAVMDVASSRAPRGAGFAMAKKGAAMEALSKGLPEFLFVWGRSCPDQAMRFALEATSSRGFAHHCAGAAIMVGMAYLGACAKNAKGFPFDLEIRLESEEGSLHRAYAGVSSGCEPHGTKAMIESGLFAFEAACSGADTRDLEIGESLAGLEVLESSSDSVEINAWDIQKMDWSGWAMGLARANESLELQACVGGPARAPGRKIRI